MTKCPPIAAPLVKAATLLASLSLACALAACATASAPAGSSVARTPQPQSDRPRADVRSRAVADTIPPIEEASVYGLYLAGEAALDAGATQDAAAYLARASAEAPDTRFITERAFAAALVAGQIDRAATLASTLKSSSDTSDASVFTLGLLTRATVDLAADRNREAYTLLTIVPDNAHSAAVTLLRPWAAAAAGEVKASTAPVQPGKDRALAAFGALGQAHLLERADQLADAEAVYKEQAVRGGVFALAYGDFLERRGRRAEAATLYDQALAKEPTDPAFLAAKARVTAGRGAPAAPTLKQGAAQALVGPAAMLLSAKQGDAGLAYLRLALRLDPGLDEAWVLVGDAMESAGDAATARDAYQRVGRKSAEYTTAQGRLALSLQNADDKEGALRLARATVLASPHDPQALVVLADLLRDDERYSESVKVLDQLIVEVGADTAASWRLYYLRGASLERAGEWPSAQADLQKALALKPDDPEVLNYLGFAWADRGEHLNQALSLLEKATALEPRSGAIVDSLGWVHYRLGDFPHAVQELELAASLDPADPEVNDHLGDAYWRIGRRLEAYYQWRRVLTLDPTAVMRASTQSKLVQGLQPMTALPRAPATRT